MSKTRSSLSLQKYDWFENATPSNEDDDFICGIFFLMLS